VTRQANLYVIARSFAVARRSRSKLRAGFLARPFTTLWLRLGISSAISNSSIVWMMDKQYYVYMTNKRNAVLYTGVTNDVLRRVYEYREKLVDGFTKK